MAADTAPVPQLTCDDLIRLQLSPQAYLDRFRSLFPRRDQAVSFVAYAEGLLFGERRKSVERMVLRELDGDMNQVRRLQYFAADSSWSDQPFLERHRQAVGAELGTREGVFLVDTTDMPKQGMHSVGVARQYCGRLGQVSKGHCHRILAAVVGQQRALHPQGQAPAQALRERGQTRRDGALGELRRGLRSLGRLSGRSGHAGAGLHGGGAGRHAGLAGAAADRRAPHPAAAGARSPAFP